MPDIFQIKSDGFSYARPAGAPLQVLSNFNLSSRRGSIHAIMAPSGAGKTTYLMGIAGAYVRNIRVVPEPLRIGFCFQNDRLIPWKTVGDNIILPNRDRGDWSSLVFRGEELLERFGLGGLWNAYPAQLSGGMRKRAALARALLRAPDLLLLDEALTGLDISLVCGLSEIVRQEVKATNAAAIFVSHDPVHVALLSDEISFMQGPPLAPIERRVVEPPVRDLADRDFGGKVSEIYETLVRTESRQPLKQINAQAFDGRG